jgi:hypothetical protein
LKAGRVVRPPTGPGTSPKSSPNDIG